MGCGGSNAAQTEDKWLEVVHDLSRMSSETSFTKQLERKSMGCRGSNVAQTKARLEFLHDLYRMSSETSLTKCYRENDLLVIPQKLRVPCTMAHDDGSDWYRSMSISPDSERNSDVRNEPTLADLLGFSEPPDCECIQAHVSKLEIFLGEIEEQPMRFVRFIVEQRNQRDGCAQSQDIQDHTETPSPICSHHSGNSEGNPSELSTGPPSEGLSCATTATSQTIDKNDRWSMDLHMDEQIKKIRDKARRGASKPPMLMHRV